ncbi:MAG: response regulator [Proteobacteria bacterium]|nr:MAG: response regulator [Pseudomonadota bacterium]
MHNTNGHVDIQRSPNISDELEGLNILVAEDTPDNQFLITRLLTRRGAHVRIAENGRIAVDEALANSYDIILMDVQMPQLDGHCATKELRQRGYEGSIVALSAHAMKEARALSLAVGCDEHLTKPVDVKHLVSVIKDYTSRTRDSSLH